MTDRAKSLLHEGDEELREWLESYIKKYPHHTTAILSRSEFIGVARAALDAYLEGMYFLPVKLGGQGVDAGTSTLEDSIRDYRMRVEGTERYNLIESFIETRTYRQLKSACSIAINENVIVVVYGRPGIGKSVALNEYAKREMNTSPINILCSGNIKWRYFLEMLATGVGLNTNINPAKLEDLIAEKLKRTPRTMFIDQANYLDERGLGTICHIWEKAHIPICLFGTKDLFNLFMTTHYTDEVRIQLSSRIAFHFLLPELTVEEVKGIVQKALETDATDAIIAQIYNITGGVHRHIDMLLKRTLHLRETNKNKLKTGEVNMKKIVTTAGSRLIIG
jgi:DNA transposition AAA+ family ATPase